MATLRNKKHKAVRGLDAVGRADLIAMSESFYRELLYMFHAVEDG